MDAVKAYDLAPVQINLQPTHVVMNYGFWMMESNRDCGRGHGSLCPYLEEICEFLNGEHAFKVIWQTTTPKWNIGDTILDHHLHIPFACHLDPDMVLHRGLVFKALSEEMGRWTELYHDVKHFAAPAYHAFNGVLLDMMVRSQNISHVAVQQGVNEH
jgi:hypothetical protein